MVTLASGTTVTIDPPPLPAVNSSAVSPNFTAVAATQELVVPVVGRTGSAGPEGPPGEPGSTGPPGPVGNLDEDVPALYLYFENGLI